MTTADDARHFLAALQHLPLNRRLRIMNVCGGHERTITTAGIRGALPPLLELIPGPGCPVCICPEEDIHAAISLALHGSVTLLAFGDMLRVPVNGPRGTVRSLEQARAAGARVVPIASPQEAVALAAASTRQEFVFFAAGFETTMAPVAAMLGQGVTRNLSVLLSGRRTWPAVDMLLASGEARIDAIIAPGHVATIMGIDEWGGAASRYGLPVAVAGFTADSLLAAVFTVATQVINGHCTLENCYAEVVRTQGNRHAQKLINEVMEVEAAPWRGIGVIPASGYRLRPQWHDYDARRKYGVVQPSSESKNKMPPGCACAQVVLGQIYPNQCPLYGKACTPTTAMGPCMVSDEGACRIWWSGGVRGAANRRAIPA